ncbi:MAG: phosphotransferase [Planctomycetota bacterium]
MDPSETVPARIDGPQAVELAGRLYGLHVEASALPGFRDENFLLRTGAGEQLVLKVSPVGEDAILLEAQAQVLDHLESAGIPAPRVRRDLDGDAVTCWIDTLGRRRSVRMLTWLPGRMLVDATPRSPALLEDLGRFLGRMDRVLADCTQAALRWKNEWDMLRAAEVRNRLDALQDPSRRALAEARLTRFEERILPELRNLRRSVIHGDANDYNILVDDAGARVTGIIDFGDLLTTALVNELGIAMAYVMLGESDPLAAASSLLAGYQSEFPLEEREVRLLPELAVTRLVVSVTCSAYERAKHPENTYLSVTEAPGWELLERLEGVDLQAAAAMLLDTRRETNTHGCP